MRNWDSCVSACKGLLFFFFRLWKKKPNNQFQTVVAKERKSERERERKRGEVKQRRKSLFASLTKTLSPSVLCLPSSLKATKRFQAVKEEEEEEDHHHHNHGAAKTRERAQRRATGVASAARLAERVSVQKQEAEEARAVVPDDGHQY